MGVIPTLVKKVLNSLSAEKKSILKSRLTKFKVTHDHECAPQDFISQYKSLKGMS
jgi:hypothetical protein